METTKSGWLRVDWVCSKSRFEPRSPRYGVFVVWGYQRTNVHKFWGFWGLWGAFWAGHIVELEGPRGLFGTGKSSCMGRVATISLQLAVFSRF